MLIAVAAIAFLFSFKANGARRIRITVDTIVQKGGVVRYSDECDALGVPLFGSLVEKADPSILRRYVRKTRKYCVEQLGREVCSSVVYVDLSDVNIDVRDVCALSVFEDLRILHIDGTQICDSDLMALRGVRSLQFVGLERTRVTENGFKTLARLRPGLKTNRNFAYENLLNYIESIVGPAQESQ